jgi:hypothetical protein
MNIDELLKFREDLLKNSVDENEFISPNSVLEYVLPSIVETKLIESSEINSVPQDSVYSIAGYSENESGERLQIYLVDSESLSISSDKDFLLHSKKEHHNSLFKLGKEFVSKSNKRHLNEVLQDSDPLAVLSTKLGSSSYVDQIDVIEFILLSLTISVENRGKELSAKRFIFEDEKVNTSFSRSRQNLTKEILYQYKLVDVSYLHQVSVSQGNADPLIISFNQAFGNDIEVLKAAEAQYFESYLCVLPASGLANLYKKESSRLLEKNVRSFLNFKVEANMEMRKTIRNSPEKFIAYNNGLTITGSSGEIIEKGGRLYMRSVTDFQIVNGGQTTAGIYFSYKDGLDISKVNLMAKINIAKDVTPEELNELITNISLYSNTQTKVSKVDLKTSNNELKSIKILSRSVVAPNQNKWFFDLSKGEFETLAKLKGNKKKLEKEYPKDRRFNKEEIGKFYTAWGLTPYLVKLGGVKVFRFFIEDISGDGDKKRARNIDRDFYEKLIAKIILFRELERIYGSGKNAIGQLRAAVIPYTISSLYLHMDANKSNLDFNLGLIWKNQKLDEMMRSFFTDLMKLINQLIKDYSQSDDIGEYSKKEQLWKDISKSTELESFFNSINSTKFINNYGVPKEKPSKKIIIENLDFTEIEKIVNLASYGIPFYKHLINGLNEKINANEEEMINLILNELKMHRSIGKTEVMVLESFIEKVKFNQPLLFENSIYKSDEYLLAAYDGIIKIYNNAINSKKSIESEFDKIYLVASKKGVKYSSVFSTIGKKLESGQMISLSEVYHATEYFKRNND